MINEETGAGQSGLEVQLRQLIEKVVDEKVARLTELCPHCGGKMSITGRSVEKAGPLTDWGNHTPHKYTRPFRFKSEHAVKMCDR